MLDCELQEAVEDIGLTYGWKNAHKLWIETRGFTTSLETAMADYPKSGLIPDDKLMESVKLLRDFPDPCDEVRYAIEDEMYGDMPKTSGATIEDLIEKFGEQAIKDLLKKQGQEQLWIDFINSRDGERIEAGWQGNELRSNSEDLADSDDYESEEYVESTEDEEDNYDDNSFA